MEVKPDGQKQQAYVNWFRDSAPYIHAHRNRTFVISFGGEAVNDTSFAGHIHDIALLNSLGIRLILVHGIRPQIDTRLKKLGISPAFHNNLRITDDQALQSAKEAAGLVRVEIESLLSMGLSNSPMSGAKVRVTSGNFITAKPIGVIDGQDYCHTGSVRKIDAAAIKNLLDFNNVVLISSIGYSPSGESFNLSAEAVAKEVAIALQAEKLLLLTEQSCQNPSNGDLIRQMTVAEAESFIDRHPHLTEQVRLPLSAAIEGCRKGINRSHLIDRHINGSLLLEIFSRDGVGTLISSTPFEQLRTAVIDDIPGILELISPLEKQGILVPRSRENLEMHIDDYLVLQRDGLIIGCTALHIMDENQSAEIACLAIHPDYRNENRGGRLLDRLISEAKKQRLETLYVLSTQTMQWFLERGFTPTTIEHLENDLKKPYNHDRKSKILYKNL